jgi:hypothetical protein
MDGFLGFGNGDSGIPGWLELDSTTVESLPMVKIRYRPILGLASLSPNSLERIAGRPVGLPSRLIEKWSDWHFVAQLYLSRDERPDPFLIYIFQDMSQVEIEIIKLSDLDRSQGSENGLVISDWFQEAERFDDEEAERWYDPNADFDRSDEYLDWTLPTYWGGVKPPINYDFEVQNCEFLFKMNVPPEGEILPAGFDPELFPWEYSNNRIMLWRKGDGEIFGLYDW